MTLILHVGASKTASTTLQASFFPRHQGIFFIGKEESARNSIKRWLSPEVEKLMRDIYRKNLDFHPDRDAVRAMVADIRERAGDRPVVNSFEDLCEFTGVCPFVKLQRFQDLFGELGQIKIVMGVREQVGLLRSLYLTLHRAEMLRMSGERMSWYPDFEQFVEINFRYAWGAVFESFRFAAVIERYEQILGAGNVFVYPFEDFKRDPVATLKSICRFMGVDENDPCIEQTVNTRENEHHSARAYAYVRLRWALTKGRSVGQLLPESVKAVFRNWVNSGKKFDIQPSDRAVRLIKEYYAADNEALFAKRGIRL